MTFIEAQELLKKAQHETITAEERSKLRQAFAVVLANMLNRP